MTEFFDIAVVGGGAAGIAASITAARTGYSTLLLDRQSAAGGTGGFSGLTTLCGLFDDDGSFLNTGFAREFAEALAERRPEAKCAAARSDAEPEAGIPLKMGRVWVLPYRSATFRAAASNLLAATPDLETRWNAPLTSATIEDNRITGLNGIRVGAVVDCSGSAEVARIIGAECLETDETTQAPAVIFPLHRIDLNLTTPAEMAQVLLPLIRAGFPSLSFQPSLEPDTVTVKFSGPVEQVVEIVAFLRSNVTGFNHCWTPLTEFTKVARAGRMIVGQYLLTCADVLAGRRFSDAVARCAWPIEQWNTDGVARFKYLPAGGHYEIPARSLRAATVQNLFMAGKTISADVDAIASARVMGCCLATGSAAGILAARYVESLQISSKPFL